MKAAFFTFLGFWLATTLAHGQSRNLECKPSSGPATQMTDEFAEGYVAAYGYPTEKMSAAVLALPLKEQHRRYVESEINRRVSYLRPYLQSVHCDSLSDFDVFAISLYTGSQYRALNEALRTHDKDGIEKFQFLSKAIIAAMDKIVPYKGVVTRGVLMTPKWKAHYRKKRIVSEGSFLSTTINDSYSQAPFQFVIKSKTGVYIAPISSAPIEDEVLFKPGTRFKVLRVEENSVTMEEVTP